MGEVVSIRARSYFGNTVRDARKLIGFANCSESRIGGANALFSAMNDRQLAAMILRDVSRSFEGLKAEIALRLAVRQEEKAARIEAEIVDRGVLRHIECDVIPLRTNTKSTA